ncbi:MAG: hypothetical protein JWM16_2046 [Verrucomicrobiales bacterium]|nr:hypothetical protein [Verrucomicrobiales bacterium]
MSTKRTSLAGKRPRVLFKPGPAALGPEVILLPWPSGAQILNDRRGSVTVIIPVLNEARTVASVVRFARRSPLVDEVIVVDDGSIDGTPELAERAGAVVVTSTMLGKGGSMEDGLKVARNETVLYLDGDLKGLSPSLVENMVQPILMGEADFVKAKFARKAGRVTVLTAKPLLRTYFPELASYEQPLGGIMAAKRSLLQSLRFENDYGVDIGLIIDAAAAKARLVEVDIGHVKHDSQPLERLGEMATQVARTILNRAARWGRLRTSYMEEVLEMERHRRSSLPSALARVPQTERLALFDMDGVLLNGRFIVELASRVGRRDMLLELLDNGQLSATDRTRRIAKCFAGVPREMFERVALEMPLVPGAVETVVGLRKAGYRVAVVTDSYQVVATVVRKRVFADVSFGHLMRFKKGKATGQATLSPAMFHPQGCKRHDHCKSNTLRHICEKLQIGFENVLAVGDGENDICMLQMAGRSVAFQPKSPLTAAAAQHVLQSRITGVLGLMGCAGPGGKRINDWAGTMNS